MWAGGICSLVGVMVKNCIRFARCAIARTNELWLLTSLVRYIFFFFHFCHSLSELVRLSLGEEKVPAFSFIFPL